MTLSARMGTTSTTPPLPRMVRTTAAPMADLFSPERCSHPASMWRVTRLVTSAIDSKGTPVAVELTCDLCKTKRLFAPAHDSADIGGFGTVTESNQE